MKNTSRPSVQTESDPGLVKLSVLDAIVLLTYWQLRRSVSTSAPPHPLFFPFFMTSSAPGSLARNIEEGISVAPRTSVPCRRLENTTFYLKKKERGSSTWAHNSSHHPYAMSWPFRAGLFAQPSSFLWLCICFWRDRECIIHPQSAQLETISKMDAYTTGSNKKKKIWRCVLGEIKEYLISTW